MKLKIAQTRGNDTILTGVRSPHRLNSLPWMKCSGRFWALARRVLLRDVGPFRCAALMQASTREKQGRLEVASKHR